ncbi:hypothetical protein HAP47_0022705 [Bradyrhizobium sp. 41S5]|uniref:hypothetical protein n=1 Tax=Bradyrhizobium sp. 41S5 TaxID=1404443 RepID=UPI001AED1A77|nr:hypothetical protein [Bradyrhizobium sp. 41S5]UFX42074.1 hypothetical protein HAP47_0022705 [Bradyrhizobium sp. 41S5]
MNGTANGVTVDLQGYESAMFAFEAGAWTDGSHTPSIQHSDDGTTFVAAAAPDIQGAFAPVTSGAGQNAVQRVGYVGSKRYVRGSVLTSGATTGLVQSMAVVRSRARVSPLP